ncbi:Glutathione-dependent formaldehyde-activating enzyme [Sulfitobacter sp. THAF37]|uniref:GFA family protein n=1 Tax=Sulfitobacter sp. THAF37 TaxID=2587855 RepID=UPI0012686342|nr:GFA family protein [Sulfitobacter sp. THAF37]QFT57214.1 Glutathione-dependent formaldehyde-activating enzyme [Sulfitobacter sp. THAF37]
MAHQKTTGSCLCGGITFEIDGAFEHFFLCHCSRCRKDTGSAHASNIFAPGGKVRWLSGADLVRSFRLSGTRHGKSFCAICGSALPDPQMDGALLVIPAGSLDTPPDICPEAHISWDDRASWDDGLCSLPRMEGLPG